MMIASRMTIAPTIKTWTTLTMATPLTTMTAIHTTMARTARMMTTAATIPTIRLRMIMTTNRTTMTPTRWSFSTNTSAAFA